MSSTFAHFQSKPNYRLLSDRLRIPVEQAVSVYYGVSWRVSEFSDMDEFASHPSAILSNGEISVFVKLSEAAHGQHQFETELAGLRLLQDRAGVLIPNPVALVPVEGGVIMVLEGAQVVERGPEQWRDIGRTLARIHLVKGERCGLEMQGYFGPLYQDNRPMDHWLDFYIERRLWPRLVGAIDSGYMPTEMIRQVERLITRLPRLDIPEVAPRLLHGDAQKNNYISTPRGAVVIDPAVYYGDPEIDLAYVDYFEDVPQDVFDGYREILPITPGFSERKELWRIAAYLAAVQVMGESQLGKLERALNKYL